jgi:hypothetical protein
VHADALAAFTELRVLSVWGMKRQATLDSLLIAVSGLPQLTELSIRIDILSVRPSRPSAACTALQVSTNLRSLQLGVAEFSGATGPRGFDLFTPGTVYPHLRQIDLCYDGGQPFITRAPVTKQQLQQLCSCCSGVEDLGLAISQDLTSDQTHETFFHLLQLSALTSLKVSELGAATAAAVGVVAQLTGLKQLILAGVPHLTDLVLMQLTALTALQGLQLVLPCLGLKLWSLKLKSPAHSACGMPYCIEAVLST